MTRPAAASRYAITVIFLTVLVDTIGFGIIIPVMPGLLMEITGKGLSTVTIYYGWLNFSFAFVQFFCAPVLGNLSDRFGRRPVILIALLAFGLDYMVMGFSQWIGWLFVARIVAGITGASFTPAYAYLADITPPEKRAQNFGLIGAAFGLGFILGPAIGGLLGSLGTRAPFFVAGGMALLNCAVGFFCLPETLPRESRRSFDLSRANPLGTLLQVRRYPMVLGLFGVNLLWQIAMQVLPSTWAFFTMMRFHWNAAEVGYSLAYVGVIMTITQGGLTRVLIPRFGGEARSALIGLLVGASCFMGYAFSSQGWMVYAWMLGWFIAGLTYPSLNALMSKQVPATAQGELQGGVASLYSLSSIVGPPLMTQTLGHFGRRLAAIYFPGAAFAVAASLAALAAVLLLKTARFTPLSEAVEPVASTE